MSFSTKSKQQKFLKKKQIQPKNKMFLEKNVNWCINLPHGFIIVSKNNIFCVPLYNTFSYPGKKSFLFKTELESSASPADTNDASLCKIYN